MNNLIDLYDLTLHLGRTAISVISRLKTFKREDISIMFYVLPHSHTFYKETDRNL